MQAKRVLLCTSLSIVLPKVVSCNTLCREKVFTCFLHGIVEEDLDLDVKLAPTGFTDLVRRLCHSPKKFK